MGSLALATVLMAAVLLAGHGPRPRRRLGHDPRVPWGVVIGNAFGAEPQQWLVLVASSAGVVLTFLAAGAAGRARSRASRRPNPWFAAFLVGSIALIVGLPGWRPPSSAATAAA